MIGWRVAWKWAVAWRLGDWSQQPTWPQVRQRRRWSQREPIFRHSSQPSALGVTSAMPGTWGQASSMRTSGDERFGDQRSGGGGNRRGGGQAVGQVAVQGGDHLGALADGGGDALDRAG